MEIQEVSKVNPSHWKKGQSGNPKGRKPGYQQFATRVEYLAGKYTVGQVKAIIEDPAKLKALPTADAPILTRMYEASMIGGRPSHEFILDRLLGKPHQSVAVDTTHTVNVVMERALGEARALTDEQLEAIKLALEKKEAPLIDNGAIVSDGILES